MGTRVNVTKWKWGLLAAAVLLPVSCAETTLLTHAGKQMTRPSSSESQASSQYKVGTPYRIGTVWYYPHEDFSYRETGIASWYGPNFHGKATANGEVFDQDALTAAHRTLPLPSYVRVTNLENGRNVVLRVNDRGPFAHNRIIDVSKRGAQLLGFDGQGTAKVKVEVMAQESRALKHQLVQEANAGDAPQPPMQEPAEQEPLGAMAQGDPTPPPYTDEPGALADSGYNTSRVFASSLPPVPSAPQPQAPQQLAPQTQAPVAQVPAPRPMMEPQQAAYQSPTAASSGYFIQAGAFSSMQNAQRNVEILTGIAPTQAVPVSVGGRQLYRVRVGPLAPGNAESVLESVRATGFPDARIVTVR